MGDVSQTHIRNGKAHLQKENGKVEALEAKVQVARHATMKRLQALQLGLPHLAQAPHAQDVQPVLGVLGRVRAAVRSKIELLARDGLVDGVQAPQRLRFVRRRRLQFSIPLDVEPQL